MREVKNIASGLLNINANILGLFYLPILITLGISFSASAQKASYEISARGRSDSLRNQLSIAASDSQRFEIITRIRMGYFENNTDSALHYTDKALQLARKNNYHLDEAQILQVKIWLLMRRGLFSESLQLLFEAGDKLQNQELSDYFSSYLKSFYNNDEPEILRQLILANSDYLLGRLFAEVGNHENSLSLFRSAKQQFAKFNAVYPLKTLNFRIVLYYISQSKLDSALILVKESEELFAESAEFLGYWNGYSNGYKGEIYLSRKNYDSSKLAYKSALAISSHEKNFRHQTEMYNGLAKVLLALDSIAIAQDYASLAIRNATSEGQQEEIATAYFTKSSIFSLLGVMDSAFYYLALASNLADSLQQAKLDNVSQFNATLLEGNLKNRDLEKERIIKENNFQTNSLLVALGLFSLIGFLLYRNNRQKQKANSVLESTLSNLKATQSQLIQSEKMASLGDLTAGIAHEIQNPLNFVNNFSEVNSELVEELREELRKGNMEEIDAIANDIEENEKKIKHHGQRADAIVKGMLQHSRSSDGQKEPTNINDLADEYLRLAYHGLRAKDKSFNADFSTDLDNNLPKIDVVPQDIGRVLLNLINNAFQAVSERAKKEDGNYKPLVTVTTSANSPLQGLPAIGDGKAGQLAGGSKGGVKISIKDNGPGIPEEIKDKIFQPFFTTKPTGQGTGLGLSLSYDIVRAHGGELKIETKEGDGSEFIIYFPIV